MKQIAPQCLHNPTGLVPVTHSLKAFIDDVVLHTTSDGNTSIQELSLLAQVNLHWWHQLVQVTGGSLNKKMSTLVYTWHPDPRGILPLVPTTPHNPVSISFSDDIAAPTLLLMHLDEGI